MNEKNLFIRNCERSNIKAVKSLLNTNPTLVNTADEDGTTALQIATFNQDVALAQLLIFSGASLDAQDNKQATTALHIASCYGPFELASLLVESGATVNLLDIKGETPLHTAARNGHAAIVQLLVENGALKDLRCSGGSGWTASMYAEHYVGKTLDDLLSEKEVSVVHNNVKKAKHR